MLAMNTYRMNIFIGAGVCLRDCPPLELASEAEVEKLLRIKPHRNALSILWN